MGGLETPHCVKHEVFMTLRDRSELKKGWICPYCEDEHTHIQNVIIQLLHHLPDSEHKDETWRHCWEELSGGAQEAVKSVRKLANETLKFYGRAPTVYYVNDFDDDEN